MLVYRIEHSFEVNKTNGHFAGPYGVSRVTSSMEWSTRAFSRDNHPSPFFDSLLRDTDWEQRPEMVCGFSSLESLNEWFLYSEISKLKDLGFVVVSYEVDLDNIFIGSHQILFVPKGSRSILKC